MFEKFIFSLLFLNTDISVTVGGTSWIFKTSLKHSDMVNFVSEILFRA